MSDPVRVLLVAGVAGGGATLRPLVRTLELAGADVTVAPAPLFRTGSIARDASSLRSAIRREADGLVVFGYSMGGLIAALALEDTSTASRVRRLVTYGAPFDGAVPLWPDARMLERIARVLADPGRYWSLVAVHGANDLVVRQTRRNVPEEDRRVVPFGHFDLFLDPHLQRLLTDLILEGA